MSSSNRSADGADGQSQLQTVAWGDRLWQAALALSAIVPVGVAAVLLAVFAYQTALFFRQVSLWHFLTAPQWTPMFASQQFGVLPLACGTFLITAIALLVAVPVGLLTAIYLSEYAPPWLRRVLKPTFDSLAGIPTVVYGYFALLWITPQLKQIVPELSGFNALSAGLATGLLVAPTIASIGEDAFRNVPEALRQGSYALGMNQRETIVRVLLPVAFPGIVAAIALAASRAFSETTIAAIAGGQVPRLTLNPLKSVESMTAFVLQVSLGDVPTHSILFQAIFTVGFVLFLVTLATHAFGHWLVSRHGRAMRNWEIPTAAAGDRAIAKRAGTAIAGSADPQSRLPSFPDAQAFEISLTRRTWLDRLFASLGLLAALLGIGVFVLLALQLQRGLPHLTWDFLTQFPSRNAEESGIYPALAGTLWLLLLTAVLAFPVGIAAAVYLEEYMPRNRFSQGLEVVLSNLAAVPSIIYGLLGLAVFARMGQAITGGRSLLSAALIMAAIVLPLLAIATRTALRAVPNSQRQAAYAVGMSRVQAVRHVVLPAAFPGILTGMLLSLSRVLGETVPLIALGAVAFVSFAPAPTLAGLRGSFTTLPAQIFYWVSRPQAEFQDIAAAAIWVLGGLLLGINLLVALARDR